MPATVPNDGTGLIDGGWNQDGALLAREEEIYDPATIALAPTGRTITPRAGHNVTLLADGKVLVSGHSAEVYDPVLKAFSQTGNPSFEMGGVRTATRLPDGEVLVTGYLESELYDPVTGACMASGTMQTPYRPRSISGAWRKCDARPQSLACKKRSLHQAARTEYLP